MEPLPKGSASYDARGGHIPAEKPNIELRFGLGHLQNVKMIFAPCVDPKSLGIIKPRRRL